MTKNFIDANGLATQDLNEIIEDLTNKFKSIYGDDVNLDQNSPDGQWINILAQEKKDTLDLITTIYNNFDVDSVVGLPQQVLYKLNGLKLKTYTYSYCYVDVTVSSGVTLQGLDENLEVEDATGFTVSDSNGNNWILTETTSLQAGTHTLNFRSQNVGNYTALANTINIMSSIVAGVVSVNNEANNYITGNVGESSAEFRERRHLAMAVGSRGFDESIASQLYDLPNVTQAKVYDNRTNATKDGIPPHTVWVIVEGGTSEEIGKVIYANIPPGIPMKGEEVAEVEKINGDIVTVNYDLPNAVDLYVKLSIGQVGTAIIDELYIKEELAKTKFLIGESAQSAILTGMVKDLVQENGNPYNVEVSTDGVSYSKIVTPSGLADYFVIDKDNINVTIVGE